MMPIRQMIRDAEALLAHQPVPADESQECWRPTPPRPDMADVSDLPSGPGAIDRLRHLLLCVVVWVGLWLLGVAIILGVGAFVVKVVANIAAAVASAGVFHP